MKMRSTAIGTLALVIGAGAAVFAASPAPAASFPGQNGKIAFARDEGTPAVVIMDADGSNVKLVAKSGADAPAPSWSADGKKLAYVGPKSEIYVTDAAGKHVKRLTKNHMVASAPTWSPDGKKIAFVQFTTDGPDIYVMDAKGKHQVDVTNSPTIDEDQPAWSPDGATIAFTSQSNGTGINPIELSVMAADGSGPKNLTTGGAVGNPNWSPDGTKLAYDDVVGDLTTAIYVANADGSNAVALTDGTGSPAFTPWWSPDGTQILFASNEPGSSFATQIFVMNPDGTGVKALTPAQNIINRHPSWQPLPSN